MKEDNKNEKSTYVLGIGGLAHDASACLLKDGQIVAAVNEERFTRKKHQGGMPEKAMQWCLEKEGITLDDVSYVGFYYTWGHQIRLMLAHLKYFFSAPRFVKNKIFKLVLKLVDAVFKTRSRFHQFKKTKKFIKIDHDLAHASSAYFNSPFDDAAVISVDLGSVAIFHGQGNKLKLVKKFSYPPVKIGMFYSLVTDYIGFRAGSDEYKVMGLASYGRPTFYDRLKDLLILEENNFVLDLSYFKSPLGKTGFSKKFTDIVGPKRKKSEPLTKRDEDLAATVQKMFEEVMLHLSKMARELTRSDNLCLCGGSALNCVANGAILKKGIFKELFVPPGVADAGITEGICYYIWNQKLGNPKINTPVSQYNSYMGPAYNNEEIEKDLKSSKVKYRFIADQDLFSHVAGLISRGRIVGWFQGGVEWGARALGNRSILGDATNPQMKDIINRAVKHREPFRPFAPAVLEEAADQYFDLPQPAPFMSIAVDVLSDKKETVPAITHVDGTARPQTVSRHQNERFWKLIKAFENIKGVPVVLNTSFNVQGEPIVNSPKDALRCFFSTGIDYLVLGNFIISKKD